MCVCVLVCACVSAQLACSPIFSILILTTPRFAKLDTNLIFTFTQSEQ